MKTIIHWRYHHWIRLWLQNSPRNMCPEEINFLFFCLELMLLVQLNSRSENESRLKNSQLNLVNSCCKGNQVSSSWIGSRVVHFKPKYLDCTCSVFPFGICSISSDVLVISCGYQKKLIYLEREILVLLYAGFRLQKK